MEFLPIIIAFLALVVFVIIMRFVGAWMLRINDVINQQREMIVQQRNMLNELREINSSINKEDRL